MVLSDLRDLFGWHFHLRQRGVNNDSNLKRSEAADDGEENQPSKKRRRVGFVIKENSEQTRGIEEISESRDLIQTLQNARPHGMQRSFPALFLFSSHQHPIYAVGMTPMIVPARRTHFAATCPIGSLRVVEVQASRSRVLV